IQLIRNALLSNGSYCLGHWHLARIFEGEGNEHEAALSWERFDRHCPDEPKALLRAALDHMKHGRLREARRAALRCVEKDSGPAARECRELLSTLPPMDPEPEDAGMPPDAAGRSVRGSRDLTR